ncbi:hypothetical protein K0M31_013742 [Melipona bicolor]|uniref:Uncharacterized protein n=1 Tax=Melipona bicolor TaxID=60889 RepID=A0AA40FH55_9HYME|nr:hypothetical protein K0M31_013742 [Melipona bicolor]
MYTNKTEEMFTLLDTENCQASLSKDSFERVGILNSSSFDFDSNMGLPSNDCLYSNVQTLNPRLIEQNFEDEIPLTKNFNTSEFNFEEKTTENNDLENIFSEKDKELYSNQNHFANSNIDMIGFELNTNTEAVLEFPSPIKSIPSFSSQSTNLVNPDNIFFEERESFPKCSLSSSIDKFNTGNVIEKFYIFQEKNTTNQTQLLNNIKNRGLPEICTSNNIPSNESMNSVLNQQEDDVQLSQKYTSVELVTSPLITKESLNSCDLLSSTDLSCNTDITSQCIEQQDESSLEQRNTQKSMQDNCKEKQKHITKHKIEISAQSRSSKRTLRCKKKTKVKKEKNELLLPTVQSNQNELNLRCSQITIINSLNYQNVQNTCESPQSTFYTSQCQISPKNVNNQLTCGSVQQLNVSQQQRILLNLHEDSMMDTIYREESTLQNQCIMEDDILEDSRISSVLEKSHIPEDKSCFKISEKNMNIDTDITKANFTTDKDITEVSSILKCTKSLPNIDVQNSTKEQTTSDEDIPLKKRKLNSKYSSSLKANTIVSPINQQNVQKNMFLERKVIILRCF